MNAKFDLVMKNITFLNRHILAEGREVPREIRQLRSDTKWCHARDEVPYGSVYHSLVASPATGSDGATIP